MPDDSPFTLSKWYLDCVAPDGGAFIGYHAELRWKRLAIAYASALRHRDGATATSTSLLGGPAPSARGRSIHWSSARLGVEADWDGLAPAVERTLFESPDGAVAWRCLHPRASAEVSVAGEPSFVGLGYVEHLEVTLPPWRLPIEELRWGRFLSEGRAVVWLDWRGPRPLTLVFDDGAESPGASVRDDCVVLDGGRTRLVFAETRTLRDGPLVETALAGVPGLRALAPARALR